MELKHRENLRTDPAASTTTLPSNETPKATRRNILKWHELPPWAQDNECILSGFRPISNSYIDCLRSFFYIHNESGNIYSHFLAMLWMLVLPTYFYPHARDHYPQAGLDDWTVFGLYFLGGAVCYALSTIYHTFSNHSQMVHDTVLRLDLLGIITVTAGCFPPGMWYTFPCLARETKIFWISLDLLAQASAAIFVLFVKRFRQPKLHPVRGLLFSFMASSAFYPIIYAIFQRGYATSDREAGASRYLLTIITYLVAVTVYTTRVPEKWHPGRFDIWGHSHQIFHVLMAVGLTVHFSAFVKAFRVIFVDLRGGHCRCLNNKYVSARGVSRHVGRDVNSWEFKVISNVPPYVARHPPSRDA